MSSHHNGPQGGDGRVVPLHVARQLLEQRDRLVEELQKARSQINELKSRPDVTMKGRNAEQQIENAEQRAREAEKRADEASVEVEQLQQKLDELQQHVDVQVQDEDDDERHELERRARRLSDDLQRVRNRTADSVEAARRNERIRLLSGLGDVLDAVDRALEMGDPEGPWRQGLEAIRNRFISFLQNEGATLIGQVGETMDPNVHQAISTVDSPKFEANTIVRVDRPGLILEDGTVVRAAQVIVAR